MTIVIEPVNGSQTKLCYASTPIRGQVLHYYIHTKLQAGVRSFIITFIGLMMQKTLSNPAEDALKLGVSSQFNFSAMAWKIEVLRCF